MKGNLSTKTDNLCTYLSENDILEEKDVGIYKGMVQKEKGVSQNN